MLPENPFHKSLFINPQLFCWPPVAKQLIVAEYGLARHLINVIRSDHCAPLSINDIYKPCTIRLHQPRVATRQLVDMTNGLCWE